VTATLSFWSGYWKSLKPLEVEEPIDVWVHRPIAYVLARAFLPTPISPNVVTFGSIIFGVIAGTSFLAHYPQHLQIGGLALFTSAVFDCADGQLARMRGTSSRFGRMLDGVADMVVSIAAVGGATGYLWQAHPRPFWLWLSMTAAIVATVVTGSFHTGMYDHYKNVFLRMTTPHFREGEDYESAIERYRERPASEFGFFARLAWPFYLFYVKSQVDYVRAFDPYTATNVGKLPEFDERRAEIYRRHAGPVMRVWRSWFGFGSLVFGIAAAAALDLLDVYMVARLVILNAVFYGYIRPAQRRASKAAFEEMGVNLAATGARSGPEPALIPRG
jgi:phosphatidylglycerophosphate synthase